ncbi:G5 domain-containing protein, partial [Streptococcus sp. 10F2]
MKKNMFDRQVQRFSLRKYSYGTVSVLLGTLLFAGQEVQADSVSVTQPGDADATGALDHDNSSESDGESESHSVYAADPLLASDAKSDTSLEIKNVSDSSVETKSEVAVPSPVSETKVSEDKAEVSTEPKKVTPASVPAMDTENVADKVVSPTTENSPEKSSLETPSVYAADPVLPQPASTEGLRVGEILTTPSVATVESSDSVSLDKVTNADNATGISVEKVLMETDKLEQADKGLTAIESTPSSTVVRRSGFRSAMLRAARSGETQVYSQAQSFSDQPGGKISNFNGYLVKSGHTDQTELVRFELDYTPTVVAGRAKEAPIAMDFSSAGNIEIVRDSVKVNGRPLPYVNVDGGAYNFWSSSNKAQIGQTNKVEFYARVKTAQVSYGNLSVSLATSFSPTYNREFRPGKYGTNSNIRNATTGTVKLDRAAFDKAVEEITGPKVPEPTVETSPIPFTTEYKADTTLDANVQKVEREGVDGQQTVTTTYRKEGKEIIATKGNPVVTKEPVSKIVKVGTKTTVVTEKVAFQTVYQDDPKMKASDPEVVVTQGKDGSKTTTTTYTLNPTTGVATANKPTVTTVDAVNKVIKRGTGQTSPIPYQTVYVANDKLDVGQRKVVTAGVNGVRHPNGTVEKAAVNEVVQMGTKPKVETTPVAYQTEYQNDPKMKASDPEVTVREGKNGSKTVTTTYTMNPTTGVVTPNKPTEQVTAPVNRIVKRGTGQTSPIPYETVYVANDKLDVGQRKVVTAGVNGVRHPNGTVEKAAVNEVVQMGTKPKVETTPVAYQTEYQNDPKMKASDPEVTVREGKNGSKTVTTTYTMNPTTGVVTPNKPTEQVTAPVNRIVKRGTGQTSPIPYETVYVANDKLDVGQRKVVTAGVNGVRHPNGTVEKAAVNEVVEMGTKPKVETTPVAYQTEYQNDPTMKASDPEVTVREGKDGSKTVTTTYTMNPTTGVVTPNKPTEKVTAPVNRIVKRGTATDADKNTPVAQDQTVKPGETVDPSKSISNLPDLPADTKVAFESPVDTSTVGDKPATVVVTYPDGSTDKVPVTVKVVDPRTDADKNTPVAQDQTVKPGDEVDASKSISNLPDLPADTKVAFESPVDTSTAGDKPATVVVTYPDGSTDKVPVTVKVVDPRTDADKNTPVAQDQTVKPGETVDPSKSISNLPDLP